MDKTYYEEIIRKYLSTKLIETREQQNLTQEQMAEKLHIATRSYIEIEHGKSMCKVCTLFYYLEQLEEPEKLIQDILTRSNLHKQ